MLEIKKNKNNSRFIYEKEDIEIKNSQCDFYKYNNVDNNRICEKYISGKPQEVKNGIKRCEYLDYNK